MSAPTGAMDRPLRDFSDCHVGIVAMLDELTLLTRQQTSPASRREAAGRTRRFFRDVVTAHHSEEESDLFSAVLADAKAGDERVQVESLVSRLIAEHRRVESLYAELATALAAIDGGADVVLDAAAVSNLVTAYRDHARLEEEVFLPLAQTILGRNSDHMAALGLSLHIRHASEDVRRRFGFI
ncbi:hemerythrin domain-containing protein [Aquabacterium sp. OR-4]|uniref:hemerythrin domain-containing protein n=1 Tax=Aquabacterium sp. OR-4 TaxID=2978127 RepID=UPI0028C888C1|nr:hemerythrin domain-containing protein [Aquabacterium sp. OR-4]MDT7839062.1 hemerythrin domain-containing protein [Aquabacterium sp. OR-4]